MKQLWLSIGALLAVAVLTTPAPSARAQANGQVSGIISGPSGPLAGMTVNVVNSAGSVVGTAVTSPAGSYSIANLPIGTYTLQVVNPAGAVLATGLGTVTASAASATVNVALTASQLGTTALAAGAGGAGGHTTAIVLGVAAGVGAGVGIYAATRSDSSPTR